MASSKNSLKPLVFFVGKVASAEQTLTRIKQSPDGKGFQYGIIYQKKSLSREELHEYSRVFDVLVECNLNAPSSVIHALEPYRDHIAGVTCRSEAKIPDFAKLIPYIPYVKTPSSDSLTWSVNKAKMRRRFYAYDKKITPLYKIAHDASQKTCREIEQKIGFPLVIKPSGLAQSLLVTICYHQEELEKELKKVFRKVKTLHKKYKDSDDEPEIIVEEFMDGDMYSIDGYVNSRGKIYFCPMMEIKTGRSIGFDDFFGYKQTTPTTLASTSIKSAEEVTGKGVHALGLRSSTFHAELIKNDQGWKLIEIGPRVGGFRDVMYEKSYNFNHGLNDILIRIPKKPFISKKVLGHTTVMKFFAPKEGIIKNLTGLKKARELESFHSIKINEKIGNRATFAKNGGKSIFNITLFNKSRSHLLADIRRLEKMINIETKKR
jgi:biotin carboxylase